MSKKIKMKNFIRNLAVLPLIIMSLVLLGGCGKASGDDMYLELAQSGVSMASSSTEENEADENNDGKNIYVYVCGAVIRPGVYELEYGSRMYEAIEMAGGMLDEADRSYLNMARELIDGEQIVVYTESEVDELRMEEAVIQAAIEEAKLGLVNINTADVGELTSLSGIGESRALAIIEYREKNGAFNSIEDIMNVTGIKDGLFSKIKDKITV